MKNLAINRLTEFLWPHHDAFRRLLSRQKKVHALQFIVNVFYVYRIKIAYDMLSDRLKDLEEKEDVKKMSDKLLQSIKSLQDTIMKIQAPNMKVLLFFLLFLKPFSFALDYCYYFFHLLILVRRTMKRFLCKNKNKQLFPSKIFFIVNW